MQLKFELYSYVLTKNIIVLLTTASIRCLRRSGGRSANNCRPEALATSRLNSSSWGLDSSCSNATDISSSSPSFNVNNVPPSTNEVCKNIKIKIIKNHYTIKKLLQIIRLNSKHKQKSCDKHFNNQIITYLKIY